MAKLKIKAIGLSTLIIGLVLFTWLLVVTIDSRQLIAQQRLLKDAEHNLELEIYLKALESLEMATRIATPHTPAIQVKLASLYLELGNDLQFVKILNSMIDNSSTEALAYEKLADYYLQNGNYSACIKCLRQGKQVSSELAERYQSLRYLVYPLEGQYQEARSFVNGLAAAKQDSQWGYIDQRGRWVLTPRYTQVSDYYAKQMLVVNQDQLILLNEQGFNEAVADYPVQEISAFANGFASVLSEGSWYIIDDSLRRKPQQWQYVSKFYQEKALAQLDGRWGLIDTAGKVLITPEFQALIENERHEGFTRGVNFVRSSEGVYLINLANEVVTKDHWEAAHGFMDGWAAVKHDGVWGYIDVAGNLKIPYKWDEARSFSCGLAAVKADGKWGYINTTGEMVIGNIYQEVYSFQEGIAAVRVDASWSYITLYAYQ